jgi:hypothetical protein
MRLKEVLVVYISRSECKGWGAERGGIQWKVTVWLGRRFGGKSMRPDITQFTSVVMVAVVGVSGFPNGTRTVNVRSQCARKR